MFLSLSNCTSTYNEYTTTTTTTTTTFVIAMLITMLFLLLLKYLFIKNKLTTTTNLPPGPTPWPILGSFVSMILNKPTFKWLHRVMEELNTDIACIRLGANTHLITVTSPEIAREFLKKHDGVFASRPNTVVTCMISRGYKTTVMSPSSYHWKKMKRVLMCHVLKRSTLDLFLEMRNEEADNLIRFVYNQIIANRTMKNSEGGVVNVRIAALHFVAGVLKRMLLGKRYFGKGREDGGPGKEDEEHVEAMFTLLTHIFAYSISDIFPWLRWFDLDGHQRIVGKAMKVINEYQDSLVKKRMKEYKKKQEQKPPTDILDILMSLKDSDGKPLLSEEEILAQVTEIFLAGIDNPFNTVEWALSEMLNHPEMLQKATEEIDKVVGNDNGTLLLQESHIPRLPYLVACAREAIRLHPIIPFNVPHSSTEECTVAGHFIPKGSHILLSRLSLGTNPIAWPDEPSRFNPDRHLPENRSDLGETNLRFISFTTGRRGCIGGVLGTNMTIMLLGRLLQCFTWKIPKAMEKIDLRSKDDGILFKATPLFAHAKPRFIPSIYV
ncbi:hypothetical protein CsatA_011466 [Cannabis sativa]